MTTSTAHAFKLPILSTRGAADSNSAPTTLPTSAEDIRSQRDYIKHVRQVHSYSPATNRLLDLYESYIPDIEAAHASGEKTAIYGGGGWTSPLLYALGVTPLAAGEMGRLSDQSVMSIAEDHYQFPVETCSMVKCTVGQWHLRRNNDKAIKKILGSAGMCEPYNMAWEMMKNEGYDVHIIETLYRSPSTNGQRLEDLISFVVEQIHDIIKWVTGGSGTVDEDKLRVEIARRNRLQTKVRRILDLRIANPFYLKTLPTIFLLNVGLGAYFGKPEEYESVLDALIVELENAKVDPEDLDRVIPLVWAGGTGQEFGVYEAIDQAGGALLGLLMVPLKPFREDIPPIHALARWTYDNNQGGAAIFMRTILEQELKKVKGKGIILYGVIGCSFQSINKEMWRDYFHQKGTPSINLEGSFQTGAPTGQLMTRVRAFIEMLS
jgi:benzoyl-CoA reductase/2-hydroxyglutaryl-CoA dehydratase subunit BcrC/BadD/HgdB